MMHSPVEIAIEALEHKLGAKIDGQDIGRHVPVSQH